MHVISRQKPLYLAFFSSLFTKIIFRPVMAKTNKSVACRSWQRAKCTFEDYNHGLSPSSQLHASLNRDYIYSISELTILNNDQHQYQSIILTNNRINSKINQHLAPFVDWCYCGREVLIEKVCLVFTSLSCTENNFLPNRQGE